MKFSSFFFTLTVIIASLSWSSQSSSFLDKPAASLNSLVDSAETQFLLVDDAFAFEFEQQGETLLLHWTIAPEYYLYRDKIKFATQDVAIGTVNYPQGETIEDEYFGTSHIYRQQLTLSVPLSAIGADGELKVKYQGCADAGLCYPPTKKRVPLIPVKSSSTQSPPPAQPMESSANMASDAESQPISEQNQLAETLASGSLYLTLLMFFGLGLGLAFTPCVFPMYPILSGIIAGRCDRMTTKYGLLLSFTYVQGMALTYAILGLVVASAGMKFQAYFQNPFVLMGMSLLFVLLALSMFGWFDISLPAKWQERLTTISNQQKSGNIFGVFLMGALSGLIASPCTTAPLSGVLLYVAQSGDLFLGGLTLYILSLGMGLPLLLLGASGGKLLPKAGMWMNSVKTVFGFLLLAVPLILLDRIIDTQFTLTAAAILAIGLCIYLYNISHTVDSTKAKTALTFVTMALFFVSLSTLQQLWLKSAAPIATNQTVETAVTNSEEGFINISTLAEFNQQLAIAKAQNKPLMIDLFAEWCIACKEFEAFTFSDPEVQQQMANFRLLRADVTKNSDADLELLENFNIMGLPTLLFFNPDAKELTQQRITGFMAAKPFNAHLKKVQKL